MKKLTEKDFKDIFQKVEDEYPVKEISGVYESVLHLETQLTYMRSEEGKKVLIDELGEIPYLEQIRIQERNLKMRKVELEVLRNSFK